jgi:hypothetical protein
MEMTIKDHWDRLSRGTQQLLTDNPGCMILPRTLTETICQEAGISADSDRHGQAELSQGDLDFIQTKAKEPQPAPPEHTFFDAIQPGDNR